MDIVLGETLHEARNWSVGQINIVCTSPDTLDQVRGVSAVRLIVVGSPELTQKQLDELYGCFTQQGQNGPSKVIPVGN